MESARVRRLIGIVLLVCLFVGLLLCSLVIVTHLEEPPRRHPFPQGQSTSEGDSEHKVTNNTGATDGVQEETSDSGINSHRDDDDGGDTVGDDIVSTTVAAVSTTVAAVTEPESTTVPLPDIEYEIHFNEQEDQSGKIYINYDGQDGFVCSDYFGDADADVICRQLGYRHGLSYILLQSTPYTRYTMSVPILSGPNCTGSESHIHECPDFWLGNVTSCGGFAAAVCYNDTAYEFRLTNGTSPNSGLVEIRIDGQWGMFCAMRNDDDDVADLVCRNMNFTGGLYLERLELGPATQSRVWVPYIYCTSGAGVKTSIFECELVLHPDNVQFDYLTHWNNRYRNEFYSCVDDVSNAASVQCFI